MLGMATLRAALGRRAVEVRHSRESGAKRPAAVTAGQRGVGGPIPTLGRALLYQGWSISRHERQQRPRGLAEAAARGSAPRRMACVGVSAARTQSRCSTRCVRGRSPRLLPGGDDRFPCSGSQRVAGYRTAAEEAVCAWPHECCHARCGDGDCGTQVTSEGRQLLCAVAVGPAPRDALRELRDDAVTMPSLLSGSEDRDQQLMRTDADPTIPEIDAAPDYLCAPWRDGEET
jgi:hypothetical protein